MYKKIGAIAVLTAGFIGLLIMTVAPTTGLERSIDLLAIGVAAVLLVQAVYGAILVENVGE